MNGGAVSDRNDYPNRPKRESIWTIAAGWANVYFSVFSTLNITNTARVIWHETTQSSHAGWSPLIDAILDGVGRGLPGNVGLTIAITDIGRVTMVLGGLLEQWINNRRERQLREAVDEAVTEAVAETATEVDGLWRAWNERRLDALAKGEPFDEPPPDISERSENGR